MQRVKRFLIILVGINFLFLDLNYAQLKIPKENIPSDIPFDVRQQIERLYSPVSTERGYAVYRLMKMNEAAAVPFLIGVLDDDTVLEASLSGWPASTTSISDEAANALVKIGIPAVDQLITAVKEGNLSVREKAVWVLGEIKDICVVKPLIAAFRDNDEYFHAKVEGILVKVGKLAVRQLITALEDKDWSVREQAAKTLGEIKDSRAVKPLIAALKDKNLSVRKGSALALKRITGQNFGEDTVKWQGWWAVNSTKFITK